MKNKWFPLLLSLILAGCVQQHEETPMTPKPLSTDVQWNRKPLSPNAFALLPLGSIKPRGWLRNQLQIQADGLTGHLDEFWPDFGPDSGWLGGSGESWERGPYYLDGLLPLAYQLEDEALITKEERWVEWTLENQRETGAIDPEAPMDSVTIEEKPVGNMPFSPEGAPIVLQTKGRKIPDWTLEASSTGPLPQSPVSSNEPDETITLIPYGSTNLRVTVFPLIAEEK